MTPAFRRALPAAGIAFLLALAWAYWPGLSGPFLLDDYGNLDVLGAFGRIHDFRELLYYATSGIADPLGRPVSLLTFLLDAHTWPAAPWPFKRTNLLLHLLNTGLLAWVVARLQGALQRRRPDIRVAPWTPLLAAALWGAHPFFASTTLYVVQREAMLPMTFVLLALLAWERTVVAFVAGRARSGWLWAIFGLGGATLLGALSKANGLLAPLLVGLAYAWFLRPADVTAARRRLDRAAWVCLGVPGVLLLGFVVYEGWHFWSMPLASRDWTLPQRLLSEPRAVWSYMARLALPRAGGGGVFVDDFVASRGWLTPASTLPAALALVASALAAWRLRRRFPIVSFAWLFFLAGHLLESSTIPLELYFEHRNYLPAMFLGWPLAHALSRPGAHARYRNGFAALLVVAMLLLTRERALVWGNPALLSVLSVRTESDSARAQADAARQQILHGDVRGGLARILAMQRSHPGSVDIAISAIGMECAATHHLSPQTASRAQRTLATARGWNFGLYQWLQDATRDPTVRGCQGFGLAGLGALVTAAEANPQNASLHRKRDLWHVRGRIALAEGRPQLALQWFDAAVLAQPDAEYALVQAAALGDAGAPLLGVVHLDHFQRVAARESTNPIRDMAGVHHWLLQHDGYYDGELTYLRQQLQRAATRPSTPTQPTATGT
jgi:hypothetical protein